MTTEAIKINEGDIIIRRTTGEVSIANDEWGNETHEDWKFLCNPPQNAHDIRQLIYSLTGYTVGTRLNTGSMKEYLTFKIAKRNNPEGARFTDQQQQQIRAAINKPGTFSDYWSIDVKGLL